MGSQNKPNQLRSKGEMGQPRARGMRRSRTFLAGCGVEDVAWRRDQAKTFR